MHGITITLPIASKYESMNECVANIHGGFTRWRASLTENAMKIRGLIPPITMHLICLSYQCPMVLDFLLRACARIVVLPILLNSISSFALPYLHFSPLHVLVEHMISPQEKILHFLPAKHIQNGRDKNNSTRHPSSFPKFRDVA